MKNQRVSFDAADGSSLRISLSKNKKNEFKTMVRFRDSQEGRTRIGCKNWFEATEEDKAQASYDELVKDAESRGWLPVQKSRKRKDAFASIPDAPQLKLEPASDEVVEQVGKLKSALRAAKR